MINEVQARILQASSHIFLIQFVDCKIMLRSRVIARFAYLNAIVAFSEQ